MLVAGAVVVVLGLVFGGLLLTKKETPAELTATEVKTAPCDTATPETLAVAHPPEAGVIYADIKCVQDRYVLARMRTTQIESNDVPAVFEFKDNAWRFRFADTEVPCGDVPRDVWKQFDFQCMSEPVVCRDGERRVIDVGGWLDCPAVLDIADRYLAAIAAGQAPGQGLVWNSGEWACSWPYEDGFAHAQVPLKCVRTADNQVVQIGDYQ